MIGAPPGLMLSASSKVPYEVDELEVAGAWQGGPLEMVPCKTVPLDVPAHAEMVIEGEVLPDVREEEGPFGEFTDSYVPVMKNHVMRVTAITRRSDALYHAILAGGIRIRGGGWHLDKRLRLGPGPGPADLPGLGFVVDLRHLLV